MDELDIPLEKKKLEIKTVITLIHNMGMSRPKSFHFWYIIYAKDQDSNYGTIGVISYVAISSRQSLDIYSDY